MPTFVDPRIVIRPARCGGVGSFAASAIRRGEKLIEQDGFLIKNARLRHPRFAPFADHCFQVAPDICIAPLVLDERKLDGVFQVNHSCEPTCGFSDALTLVAMRDIAPGEEITYDYAMTDMDVEGMTCAEMRCLCGTPSCRVVVTGKDWMRSDLQRKYAGYFSPYLRTEIARRSPSVPEHPA